MFFIIIRNKFQGAEAVSKDIIQEEIHQFIENFKYFTAILALCFNFPTPFIQFVSMSSSFWCRPTHPPPKHQQCQHFGSDPPTAHPKCADIILERSFNNTHTVTNTDTNLPKINLWSKIAISENSSPPPNPLKRYYFLINYLLSHSAKYLSLLPRR